MLLRRKRITILHRVGDERAFWAQYGIRDPLKFAARLASA
jgi:hypothetical protein